jgi:HAD superfamily hydrolase (TIGR01509 family)
MIKAILFDMDGVLVDAREWHYAALNRALDLFGLRIGLDSHLSTFDGLPTKRKLQILTQSRGLPAQLHDFINEMKQRFTMEIVATHCKPTFQHRYALGRLRKEGYRLAVCSNSVRNTVTTMMALTQLDTCLEVMLSNEDVVNAKPDPEIYMTAMARLGVAPAECLIVEDMDHGIQAARASGGHVLTVASPADVSYERVVAAIAQAEAGQ